LVRARWSWESSFHRLGAPKTDRDRRRRSIGALAMRGARAIHEGSERTATYREHVPVFNLRGVGALSPFIDIAGHIVSSVGTHPIWKLAHRRNTSIPIVISVDWRLVRVGL